MRSTDYKPITNDIRRKVCFENQVLKVSLSKICKAYNINFLSAKNVIQNFQREGRIEKKASVSKDSNELKSMFASILSKDERYTCTICGQNQGSQLANKIKKE